MSTDLIERAARALWDHSLLKPYHALTSQPAMGVPEPEPDWQRFIPIARAVLEAIREPGEAMTEVGGEQVLDTEFGAGQYESIGAESGRGSVLTANEQAQKAWRAMIDAALGEKE